ncbi:MAG: thioredoxin-disulfide reductase [Clostridia bacterium]|nr:thioredoxin-disulfide reductase [Clostridia bacterium]
MYDIIIAGGGPAGLTSAIYGARGGLNVLVLERSFAGGQMAISHTVENYPGFENDVPGALLANNMHVQATRLGAEFKNELVKEFDIDGDVKKLHTRNEVYEARTVVLAMGATPRKLGIAGEEDFIGAGVSYCATCDGAFFKGANVAVIGGGNTALEDALFLARYCEKVYLVHRRDTFRAQHALVKLAEENDKIEFVLDSTGTVIQGKFTVDTLVVENLKTKEKQDLKVTGVFVAVGQQPTTELVRGKVDLDDKGYIIAGEDCKTNVPGVFCAGDIRTKEVRQIVTAAADGAVASYGCELYLL